MLCLHGAGKRVFIVAAGSLVLLSAAIGAKATEAKTYEITLKGQTFTPAELKVPAGEAFTIRLMNQNDAPAEFESKEMKFEKVVTGKSQIKVNVKALPGGTFEYYDEYHEDTVRGAVTAE